MIGQRFGRLTVIERASSSNGRRWACLCNCGKEKTIAAKHLKSGDIKSCGCLSTEVKRMFRGRPRKYGLFGSEPRPPRPPPEYEIWRGAIARCTNPQRHDFKYYGGRGIKICDRWRHSFQNFLADMGPRPSPQHSIDRINNDGDYEPDNCRWVTWKEQAANRRPHGTASSW